MRLRTNNATDLATKETLAKMVNTINFVYNRSPEMENLDVDMSSSGMFDNSDCKALFKTIESISSTDSSNSSGKPRNQYSKQSLGSASDLGESSYRFNELKKHNLTNQQVITIIKLLEAKLNHLKEIAPTKIEEQKHKFQLKEVKRKMR